LPWLALPIGVEYGFSSAGAGALGSVLLLNYSEMTAPEVVGTDLIFGLVLAAIGGAFHWKFGAINSLFFYSSWPVEFLGLCLDACSRGTFPREN